MNHNLPTYQFDVMKIRILQSYSKNEKLDYKQNICPSVRTYYRLSLAVIKNM